MDAPLLLLADDDPAILDMLSMHAEGIGFTVIQTKDGLEALEACKKSLPDIIVLDMMMPNLTGLETLEQIKKTPVLDKIPAILLTGAQDRDTKIAAYGLDVHDFITKPVDMDVFKLRLKNALKVKRYEDYLKQAKMSLEELVDSKTRHLSQTLKALEQSHQYLKISHRDTIKRLAVLSEFRDQDTGDHILRIGEYSRLLASCIGFDSSAQEEQFHASILHDIGKIGIPDAILLKPALLTPEEWEIMKTHTTIGKDILFGSVSPLLSAAADIAWSHHERWDGSGYPRGLAGEDIPLSARLVTMVDVYDGLRAIRPYKKPVSHASTLEIIRKGDGRTDPGHFDPEILDVFLRHHRSFDEIFNDSIANADRIKLGETLLNGS